MPTNNPAMADIANVEKACASRNKRELYRLMALFIKRAHPDCPIDIEKVRAMARVYAGEFHGWEIDNG